MRHAVAKRLVWSAAVLVLAGMGLESLDAQPGFKGKGKKGPRVVGPFETIQGTIREFTTAPKGETDGAMLNDDTWVHWPPHLADRFTEVVRKGDRVRAVGRWETGKKGETKFEVSTVTNLRTGNVGVNPDLPAPADVERGAARGVARGAAPGGDIDRRLRALEERLDELVLEVQRLRKKR